MHAHTRCLVICERFTAAPTLVCQMCARRHNDRATVFFTCHFINCAYHMILVLYFLYCGDIRSSHEFRPCLNTTHQIIIIDFVIVICLHAVITCTCLMAISRTRVLRSVWTCVIFYVPILFIMYFLDLYFRHSEDK